MKVNELTIEEKNRVFAEFMGNCIVALRKDSTETLSVGYSTMIFSTWEECQLFCDSINAKSKDAYEFYIPFHKKIVMRYDSSFEWLMEVVEKVESIKLPSPSIANVSVQIRGNSCRIYLGEWNESKEGFISCVSYPNNEKQYTKKEATYNALYEFILWYNEWHKK